MGTHKQLKVWINSMELVKHVYRVTSGFPENEIYGLTNQIRRAAISVPANISEGSARKFPKELLYFLRVSFGSLNELETLLLIASDLTFMKKDESEELQNRIRLITAQLSGLMKSIRERNPGS